MIKKVVIAPDSFKGTMRSMEVCEIVESSIKKIFSYIDIVKVPIADGGEGTVDSFLYALGGEKAYLTVTGPYFRDVKAYYGVLKDQKTAVIEMAQASGLMITGKKKNVLEATSYGTGELIKDALDRGCKKIILGIGGSATCDGGIGALGALGVRFLNKQNKDIRLTGRGLEELNRIDARKLDARLKDTEILVACDVKNVLYGKNGASYVFAPQKGASKEEVKLLDKNLKNYSKKLIDHFKVDYSKRAGTGAAGGIGISLLYFTNASLTPGIEIILDTVNFNEIIRDADLVLTGEGKIDGQSLFGKVPFGVASYCKKLNVPVIAIAGSIAGDINDIYSYGIEAVFSTIKDSVPFEIAKKTSKEDLGSLIESLMKFYRIKH